MKRQTIQITLCASAVAAALIAVVLAVYLNSMHRSDGDALDGRDAAFQLGGSGPTRKATRSAWKTEVECAEQDVPCAVVADDDGVVARVYEDGESVLVALDGATGTEQWRQEDGRPGRYPSLLGPHLLTLDPVSIDRTEVELLDRASGKVQWTGEVGSYGVAFALARDRILVTTTGDVQDLTAFDVETGATAWKAPGFLLATCGEIAYLLRDDQVFAVDLHDGEERWSFPDGRSITADEMGCTSGGGLVIVREDASQYGRPLEEDEEPSRRYELTVHAPGDGRPKWSRDLGSADAGSIFIESSDLVVIGGTESTTAFDADTGEVRWQNRSGFPYAVADAIVSGDRLIVQDWDAEVLHLLDRSSGEPTTTRPGTPGSDLSASEDLLVIGAEDGSATAYDPATLESLWTAEGEPFPWVQFSEGSAILLTDEAITAYR